MFHVLNRGNERRELFEDAADYDAFVRVMAQSLEQVRVSLLSYCLMPNHWHLVLRPEANGDLGRFMQRLTVTHVRRWREHRRSVGLGHLYQGPYKSFPVQEDAHFLVLCRYVERNALRAQLAGVQRAEDWRWSSLWQRLQTKLPGSAEDWPQLSGWPVNAPKNWVHRVNQCQTQAELDSLRLSLQRGRPLGSPGWTQATADRLGLSSTMRRRGRPKKAESEVK